MLCAVCIGSRIADVAFSGKPLGYGLHSASLEYSTDDTFAKCWVHEDGVTKLMKHDSYDVRSAYSEFYISQLAEVLDLNVVSYSIMEYHSKLCSACDTFTLESIGFVPYSSLDSGSGGLESVLVFCMQYCLEEELREMFVFDSVILMKTVIQVILVYHRE